MPVWWTARGQGSIISTLSGAIELAGEAENAEIETASGKVDIAGALGALDFESVSGNLIFGYRACAAP